MKPTVLIALATLLAASITAAAPAREQPARKVRSLEEYRHFRALSVDLVGRVPTRDELAAFEKNDFDLGAWVEDKLRGPGYVDRLSRVYMDALRLEANPLVVFAPAAGTLYAETIKDESGKLVRVFYRKGQRRADENVDGDFCLTAAQSGVDTTKARAATESLPKVPKVALDQATVRVKPWWMYRDYRAPNARERIGAAWTPSRYFQPYKDLLLEPDGTTEAIDVRVCREEAQTAEKGTLWVSPRFGKKPLVRQLPGRASMLPLDDPFASKHVGEPLECSTQLGLVASLDCGCGPGLERCIPQLQDYAPTFMLPSRELVGLEGALPFGPQQLSHFERWWWRAEALQIMGHVFAQDLDVRELVRGRFTYVNGPLSQFYRFLEPASCCNHERNIPGGMMFETEPLFRTQNVPALLPHEVDVWTFVPDRGPQAAGILTTPVYLQKFASRRARAAAAYTGLLCKSFLADTSGAAPSKDPNLMVRPGCASCHATLEPLAAYFSRVKEGSTTYLSLPAQEPYCKSQNGKLAGFCPDFYDPAFSDAHAGIMRGAYASRENAEGGPHALGEALAASPEYVGCAVEQVTSSLLGRPLTSDDDALRARLLTHFKESGNRMRTLVRDVVMDPVYARARTALGNP